MDKKYILLIKGFIVGIGKIIPGVSGSLLAISMGIYDKALNYIGNFYKDIKSSIKFLMPIGIGLLLAILFFSNLIFYFINKHYFPIMLLFLGLIMGGIPSLLSAFNKVKIGEKDKKFIIFVICLFIILYLFYDSISFLSSIISNYKFIYWFIIGVIDALTMIIPGISGTAILIMIGCYNEVILMYANPLSNIQLAIPFILGMIITVLLLTKIFSWLFDNCSKSVYLLILILVFISLISLIQNVFSSPFNILSLIVGIILFIVGFILSYLLDNMNKRY